MDKPILPPFCNLTTFASDEDALLLEQEKERRRKAWKELKKQEERVRKEREANRKAWLNLTQGKGPL